MSTKLVQLSMSGSVAVVTLDDPDRRNVLSREMVAGIETAFDEAEADDRVRALTFTSRKAGEGYGPKQARAQRMLVDYERPGPPVRHVLGTHNVHRAADLLETFNRS